MACCTALQRCLSDHQSHRSASIPIDHHAASKNHEMLLLAKVVLELGAGTGLVSVVAARLGATHSASP